MKKLIVLFLCFVSVMGISQCPTTDIILSSQADVENFGTNYPGCTSLISNLTISGLDIDYLYPLQDIVSVNNLYVINNPILFDLGGLDNITTVNGDFIIRNNDDLTFTSLTSLITVLGDFIIENNRDLEEISTLIDLVNVSNNLIIRNNSSLTDCTISYICTLSNTNIILSNNSPGCNDRTEICPVNNAPNDCVNAIKFCGQTSLNGLITSGFGNFQEVSENNPCALKEEDSIWLELDIATGGTFGFLITALSPDKKIDFDFWVYGPSWNCGDQGRNPIRCSTHFPNSLSPSPAVTGMENQMDITEFHEEATTVPVTDGFIYWMNVLAGERYYVVINRYAGTSNFDINFTGTATLIDAPNNESFSAGTEGNPSPNLNLSSCDTVAPFFDNITTFNLEQNTAPIIGSQTGVTVTYHLNSNDALIGINSLSSPYTNTTNGQTIFVRFENATGCFDTSSFTLNVNLNATFTPAPISYCDGQTADLTTSITPVAGYVYSYYLDSALSVLVSDETAVTSGTYYITLTNGSSGGCSYKPASVLVSVNPIPIGTPPTPATLCNGQTFSHDLTNDVDLTSTFQWQATDNPDVIGETTTLSTATTITDTLTNTSTTSQTVVYTITPTSAGCTGVPFTVTVTIDPTPTGTPITLPNICSGDAILHNLTGGSFQWQATDNPDVIGETTTWSTASAITDTLTNTSTTSQTVIYTINPTGAGCAGVTFTVTVTIDPTPTGTPITLPNICSGDAILHNLTGGSFQWQATDNPDVIGETTTWSTASAITDTLTNTSTTSQTVVYTINPTGAGCAGVTFTVTVTIDPTPTGTPITLPNICSGDAILHNLTGGSFQWQATDNPDVIGETTTWSTTSAITDTLTNTSTTSQTVIYTINPTGAGCAGVTFTVTVSIDPKPISSSTILPEICSGEAILHDLNTNISFASGFQWQAEDNPNIIGENTTGISASTINNVLTNTSNVLQTVIYNITPIVINNSCPGAPFTVRVNVYPELETGIPEDYVICLLSDGSISPPKTTTTLQNPPIDTLLSVTDFSFQWYAGTQQEVAANPSLILLAGETDAHYIPTTGGFYSVIATNLTTGCVLKATAFVNESYPPEKIDVTLSNLFTGNEHELNVDVLGTGEYEYQLNGGPWQSSSIFKDLLTGQYVVGVRDLYNCDVLEQIKVIMDYPLYFTPNNDGINDTWHITGLKNQAEVIIYIYDRYGKLIKQLDPLGSGWDGTYNGYPMPTNDYWFSIDYTEEKDITRKQFKAHFVLKR